ncbi:MAG: hypothetical protein AAFV88_20805 [Planctomycetota bacterium]
MGAESARSILSGNGASPEIYTERSALDDLRPNQNAHQHFQEYKHPDPRFDEVFRLLHAAAERERYYSPLITNGARDGRPQALLGASFPSDVAIRSAAELLLTRASVVNNRESAWRDILASYRLGRLVAMGPDLEDARLGMQVEQLSIAAVLKHIERYRPNSTELLKCREDLGNMPAPSSVSDKVNLAERCKCLDSLMYLPWYMDKKSANFGSDLIWQGFGKIYQLVLEQGLREADWDPALEEINQSFDETVRILNLANINERRKALDDWERTWKVMRAPYTPPQRGEFSSLSPWEGTPEFLERMETLAWLRSRLDALAKPAGRSGKLDTETESDAVREIGRATAAMMQPVYLRAFITEQRTRQSALNLELALGLAAFHADHQRYPERLADLEPKYLTTTPVDGFSGNALIYRLEDNGCLFYSVGENGRDDDGMLDRHGADDLSVRMENSTDQ